MWSKVKGSTIQLTYPREEDPNSGNPSEKKPKSHGLSSPKLARISAGSSSPCYLSFARTVKDIEDRILKHGNVAPVIPKTPRPKNREKTQNFDDFFDDRDEENLEPIVIFPNFEDHFCFLGGLEEFGSSGLLREVLEDRERLKNLAEKSPKKTRKKVNVGGNSNDTKGEGFGTGRRSSKSAEKVRVDFGSRNLSRSSTPNSKTTSNRKRRLVSCSAGRSGSWIQLQSEKDEIFEDDSEFELEKNQLPASFTRLQSNSRQ